MAKRRTKVIRHGDVLLVQITAAEAGALRGGEYSYSNVAPARAVTLAEGEATGHAHVLTAPEGQQIKCRGVWARNGGRELLIETPPGGAELTHEEHKTVKLPGLKHFRVTQQREFWGQEERRVTD